MAQYRSMSGPGSTRTAPLSDSNTLKPTTYPQKRRLSLPDDATRNVRPKVTGGALSVHVSSPPSSPPSPSLDPGSPSPNRSLVRVSRPEDAHYEHGDATLVEPRWTREQDLVIRAILDGYSCYVGGLAGSGKSVVVSHAANLLLNKKQVVRFVASSGLAASSVDGTTIHSFFGLGHVNERSNPQDVWEQVRLRKGVVDRVRWTDTLVIDEVSMLPNWLWIIIEYITRQSREGFGDEDLPFGGMQIIYVGDMLQLPPITLENGRVPWIFNSDRWRSSIKHWFFLAKTQRQQQPEMITVLDHLRVGYISKDVKQFMDSQGATDSSDLIRLVSTRAEVTNRNEAQLNLLKTSPVSYTAITEYSYPDTAFDYDWPVPDVLTLKTGALVMCVANIPNTQLVNGLIGTILGFASPPSAGIGDELVSLDENAPNVDLSQYCTHVPIVEFRHPKHGNLPPTFVLPRLFRWNDPDGEVIGSRKQLPLVLAYGITVHKAQGQTLPYVTLDMNKAFAPGQIYVGVSRCVSKEAFTVIGWNPNKIKVNTEAVEWLEMDLKYRVEETMALLGAERSS